MIKHIKIFLMIIFGFIILIIVIRLWNYQKTPSMARNLPSNYLVAQTEFKERVNDAFPIGINNTVIVESLSKQGFSLDTSNVTSEKVASFSISGFICRDDWIIHWTVDENDTLSTIRAQYYLTCL